MCARFSDVEIIDTGGSLPLEEGLTLFEQLGNSIQGEIEYCM